MEGNLPNVLCRVWGHICKVCVLIDLRGDFLLHCGRAAFLKLDLRVQSGNIQHKIVPWSAEHLITGLKALITKKASCDYSLTVQHSLKITLQPPARL